MWAQESGVWLSATRSEAGVHHADANVLCVVKHGSDLSAHQSSEPLIVVEIDGFGVMFAHSWMGANSERRLLHFAKWPG